jgi:hypothetical protein
MYPLLYALHLKRRVIFAKTQYHTKRESYQNSVDLSLSLSSMYRQLVSTRFLPSHPYTSFPKKKTYPTVMVSSPVPSGAGIPRSDFVNRLGRLFDLGCRWAMTGLDHSYTEGFRRRPDHLSPLERAGADQQASFTLRVSGRLRERTE